MGLGSPELSFAMSLEESNGGLLTKSYYESSILPRLVYTALYNSILFDIVCDNYLTDDWLLIDSLERQTSERHSIP